MDRLDGCLGKWEEYLYDSRAFPWEKVFPMPAQAQIASHRSRCRSPYLAGWLEIPSDVRYTEYKVDFRAAHLPRGTYCCLGNWAMDLSTLEKKYASVRTEYAHVNGYAGFQKIGTGKMVSIMSFWDIFCKDFSGRETVIRAKRLYPDAAIDGDSFWGEGTGARCIAPYPWKENRWYRMHLKCVPAQDTGNTLVEQWATDLETGKKTLLARFDLGFGGSAFRGSIAVFLENFLEKNAGQVRSMEVRRARYRRADTGLWVPVTDVYLASQGGMPNYEGSYRFGVEGERIWMITSGVGGDWFSNGRGQSGTFYKLAEPQKRAP